MTATLATDHILFGSTRIDFTVLASSRRRSVSLRVGPEEGVEVVVPEGVAHERVQRIVRDKAPWILEKLGLVREQTKPAKKSFVSGESFLYAGRRYRLRVTRTKRAHAALTFESGGFRALVPAKTSDRELALLLRPVFVRWYRDRAATRIEARVKHFAGRMGLRPSGLLVKEQERRWGSCTRSGVLGFNWRIVMAPLATLDYVVAHELAHLVERDHGQRFWRLLGAVMPDYEERREWLRLHGAELTL
jgi:predicted metal-dependent hydrolase